MSEDQRTQVNHFGRIERKRERYCGRSVSLTCIVVLLNTDTNLACMYGCVPVYPLHAI